MPRRKIMPLKTSNR